MSSVTLTIDGTEVQTKEGATVLEAVQSLGIYIPALCYHPDLPPAPSMKIDSQIYRGGMLIEGSSLNPKEFEGCQLCVVEIEGTEGFVTACNTPVVDGMIVHTNTPQVQKLRRDNLAKILAKHPHACLVCAESEGCSREPCSLNVPVNERCCDKFGNCELQRVAEYIGIGEDVPRYVFRELPVEETPLFIRDHNLCISCGRCVRVCRDVRGVEALGVVYNGEEYIVGSLGPSLKESECKFCGACVEVCPTGALMDKDLRWPASEEDLVPCKHTCPAGIDVPRYIRLINDGKLTEAAAVIREKAPLPSVLGYICHHPCEDECRRGKVNEAMSICALKRFAAEHDAGLWKANLKKAPPTGKRVAIVGSGPAGLTAAYYLARKGHSVTMFESLSELGGMMRFGAPEYRLPREVLEKDVRDILELGVDVKTGVNIGEDLSLKDLENQSEAIFLATGAPLSKKLKIEGVELEGVLWGLDLLRDVNSGRDVKVKDRVLVIGGGNVAIDVARTALRSGAKKVQLACLESREEMPAHEWQIEEAVEEGVILNVSWGPKRIMGDGDGVTRVELVRCTSVFDDEGRFNPSFDEEETVSIETNMVIIAIGQASDLSFLHEESQIQATRGTIEVDEDTLQTGVPKIFAGGDVVSGAASVIEAIAMGRKAAVSIDRFLGGDGVIDEALVEPEKPDPWLGREEGFTDKSRVQISYLPLEKRLRDFSVVELGFDEEMAVEEAKRCLRCDLRLEISPVVLPPEKWLEFSLDNVSVVLETSGVYQLLDEKKMIIYIAGTPNLRQDLEQQLKTVKKARYFGYEEEPMYTKRESELIQKFLKEHGKMPELNEELFDLF
ncbi:MAG: FAD-dependent oxidoreductase [Candidatus Bathyarchaeia archaeon]